MTAAKTNQSVVELNRSLQVAGKEVKLLHQTRERLFHGAESVDAGWVKRVAADVELSERLEAFSARFARLQDMVMDKLLPRLLAAAGEAIASAIDNLNRADRLGLVERPEEWIALRQLRKRLVHEYMDDAEEFATVLNVVLRLSGELIEAVERIRRFSERHFGNE
jgi:uncharacterized protein with HEPN domain